MTSEVVRRLVGRVPALLALPAAMVIAAVVVGAWQSTWHLTGDYAHTELLVRSVPSHPPLVGVAARVRGTGATPGPSMAYLLAPAYWLLGGGARALAASVAVLHVTAIAATVHVVARLAGLRAAAGIAVGLLLTVVALGPQFFLEPWNVWVPLFALPLLMALVWAALLGHAWALVPVVLVASHCMQTHVGYTVVAGGLTGVAATAVAWRFRTAAADECRRLAATLAASAGAGVVAWLPPLVEQARVGTGNLRKVLEQFLAPQQAAVGAAAALEAAAARLNIVGMWQASTAGDARSGHSVVGAAATLLIVVVAVSTAWRADAAMRRWTSVLAGTTALGILSASRVFGTFFEYVVRWFVPLTGLWLGTAAWGLLRRRSLADLRSGQALPRARSTAAVVVAMLALSGVGVARAAGTEVPHSRDGQLVAALAEQLRPAIAARLERGDRLRLDEVDIVSLGSVTFGLVVEFDSGPGRLGVGEWGRWGVQPHRVVAGDADGALWLVTSQRMIDHFAALDGATVLALADVRTSAEAAQAVELEAELVERLCATGRPDLVATLARRWGYTVLVLDESLPDDITELVSELITLGQVAAVVELPLGTDGFAVDVPPPTCMSA
ncbi:MAG: hypothetical protein ACKO27_09140 [Ilumatobacteraceae bacterium]